MREPSVDGNSVLAFVDKKHEIKENCKIFCWFFLKFYIFVFGFDKIFTKMIWCLIFSSLFEKVLQIFYSQTPHTNRGEQIDWEPNWTENWPNPNRVLEPRFGSRFFNISNSGSRFDLVRNCGYRFRNRRTAQFSNIWNFTFPKYKNICASCYVNSLTCYIANTFVLQFPWMIYSLIDCC